eukprot:TRINITY_DN2641_c0_g2_i2.p1 TRINITY_DN2641_c0_g2~~TRINITY_DN2641_c0_g2_i2.p1  ORF type:complete len:193 (-),score=31.79 TRINITY_DN2641_c0_g2_i2:10-588(-)
MEIVSPYFAMISTKNELWKIYYSLYYSQDSININERNSSISWKERFLQRTHGIKAGPVWRKISDDIFTDWLPVSLVLRGSHVCLYKYKRNIQINTIASVKFLNNSVVVDTPLEKIPLQNVQISVPSSIFSEKHRFNIKDKSSGIVWWMGTDSPKSRDLWVKTVAKQVKYYNRASSTRSLNQYVFYDEYRKWG